MRDVFAQVMLELARADSRIMLLTADLGFSVFETYAASFPSQYLNVGVAEQNMTGIAAGLAMEGRIVFTYSIANFPTLRCLEQIRNDICHHHANVRIVAVGGGLSYGALGASHHATEDLAILRSLPHLAVVAPGDLWEAAEATRALAHHSGPAYLRLDRSFAVAEPQPGECFTLGAVRCRCAGDDITLVASGGILGETLRAAELLRNGGVRARVLSLHSLAPLDREALQRAARETGGIVTVEEHTLCGGVGSAVAEALLDAGVVPERFLRLGLRGDYPSLVGGQTFLRARLGLDAAGIEQSVRACLDSRPKVVAAAP